VASYDLLLQPTSPDKAFDLAPVEAELAAANVPRRPDGVWLLTLKFKDLELSVLKENGVPIALQCSVPLSDRTEVVEAAVAWAIELARKLELRVMDPQLNTVLTQVGASVGEEFLRQARYAGEYLGVSEAIGATHLARPMEGMNATTRLMLGVVVFIVVTFVTISFVQSLVASEPEPERSGPPPGWRGGVRDSGT
jgi:hypothetical protein